MIQENTSDGEHGEIFLGVKREQLEGATLPQGVTQEKQTFPKTLKISTPALDDSHPGPLRETCGAFQKHANMGGKLKPR